MTTESPRTARPSPARGHRLLFPLAALFGAAAVPLWGYSYGGILTGWAPPAFWHGHEMLFGFALAVVGGYLVTQASARGVALALALWGLGRLAALQEPAGMAVPAAIAAAAALAYPVCLFVLAGLPLLRAAKRWRNLVFAPILAAFVLAELVFQAGVAGIVPSGESGGLALALGVVALLLFVMGGRVISAICSGARQRAGAAHRDMAQGRVEMAGVASLAIAALAAAFGADALAAAACAVAAALVLARLARWRAWTLWRQPEAAPLVLGYAWLCAGLALLALVPVASGISWADALHGVGAGTLGTLAATMMLRVAQQRARRTLTPSRLGMAAVLLVNLAALARLAVIWLDPWRLPLIELAAALWCAGFLLVFLELIRVRPRFPSPSAAGS